MFTRYEAKQYAKQFVQKFDDDIIKANMVGSWVRDPKKHAYVSDVDLLCVSKRKLYHGAPLDIWFVDEDQWEAAALYLSIGQTNIKFSARAKWRKLKFTYKGLFKRGRLPKLVTTSAEEICKLLEVEMPESARKVIYEKHGRIK
jgi:DNA polymerase/3'-5' exonuclease PolX